tara:strand:+ start:792 stop:1310 length:519 start_codon:yes stop_codon:yes gene_type:complete
MPKSIGILTSLLVFLSFYCKNEPIEPFELSVSDYNYASAYSMEYKLTEKELTITFRGELEGEIDSLLFSTMDLPKSKIRRISSIKLDNLNDIYMNNCVEDGDVKIVGLKRDSIIKFVQLNNYYHPELSPVFEMINGLVPDKLKMYHDKEDLKEMMANCDSFNIIKDREEIGK